VTVADAANQAVAPHPALVSFWRGVTTALQPVTWEVLAGVAAIGLLRRRSVRLALFLLLAIFGTVGLYDLVKAAVGRHRPVVPHPLLHPFGASFPSGHAMMSAVAMTLVAIVVLRVVRAVALAAAAVAGCVLVAALVAASRVLLGAHYLSDVVGGWLLAAAWLSLLVALFRIDLRRPSRPPHSVEW